MPWSGVAGGTPWHSLVLAHWVLPMVFSKELGHSESWRPSGQWSRPGVGGQFAKPPVKQCAADFPSSCRRGIILVKWSMNSHRSEEHTSELQSLRHLVCRL